MHEWLPRVCVLIVLVSALACGVSDRTVTAADASAGSGGVGAGGSGGTSGSGGVGRQRRHERYGRHRRRRGSAGTGGTGGPGQRRRRGSGGAVEPGDRGSGRRGRRRGDGWRCGQRRSAGAAGSTARARRDSCAPKARSRAQPRAEVAADLQRRQVGVERHLQRQQQLRHERREPRLVPADRERVRGQGRGLCVLLGGNAVTCGIDLVTIDPVETCTNQACVSGACAGVCAPTQTAVQERRLTPQTCCVRAGTWGRMHDGTARTRRAWAARARGVHAGAKQCCGNGVQTCSSSGQWGAAVACASADAGVQRRGLCGAPSSCQTTGQA